MWQEVQRQRSLVFGGAPSPHRPKLRIDLLDEVQRLLWNKIARLPLDLLVGLPRLLVLIMSISYGLGFCWTLQSDSGSRWSRIPFGQPLQLRFGLGESPEPSFFSAELGSVGCPASVVADDAQLLVQQFVVDDEVDHKFGYFC